MYDRRPVHFCNVRLRNEIKGRPHLGGVCFRRPIDLAARWENLWRNNCHLARSAALSRKQTAVLCIIAPRLVAASKREDSGNKPATTVVGWAVSSVAHRVVQTSWLLNLCGFRRLLGMPRNLLSSTRLLLRRAFAVCFSEQWLARVRFQASSCTSVVRPSVVRAEEVVSVSRKRTTKSEGVVGGTPFIARSGVSRESRRAVVADCRQSVCGGVALAAIKAAFKVTARNRCHALEFRSTQK